MKDIDNKDHLIMLLAERVYICSRLLTAAADRSGWDSVVMKELTSKLVEVTETDVYAYIKSKD